ncbi:hypothetical protein LZ31DRAFT_383574 [Colletotrichum somersetense]|nr:hypothetical protein LZ31DRAFT_383574 [Colletotrichum somersetense]
MASYANSRQRRIPRFELTDDFKVILAPGEVYCRFDCGDGFLCHRTSRFSRRQGLVKHLRDAHDAEVVSSATGALSGADHQRQVKFYRDMKRLALGHATALNTPVKSAETRRTSTKMPVPETQDGQPDCV